MSSTIYSVLRPHPTKLILEIAILDCPQGFKQFQKPGSNISVAKFNLLIAICDTLYWLEVSNESERFEQ